MNILVTGCAGFIGFHLCENLKNKNINIIGIDNLNNYYSKDYKKKRLAILKKKKNFKFFKLDISDYKKLDKLFSKNRLDVVVNLAAQAGVRHSIKKPNEYVESNINGFFNIIELSRIWKVKKVFYASSSSVYGEKNIFPLKENQITHPKNIYSLSKKSNEEMANIYSNFYKMKFVGLRFFTIYGEWGRPDMFILKYISSIQNKKNFYLNNFGDHYRDFTYIDDAIKNILALLKKNFKKKHEIFNICSNNPVSLKKIIKQINNELGKPKIIKRKMQQADVYKTHGSNLKLIKMTKIKKFTDIKVGTKNVIDWAKKNGKYLK